MKVSNLQNADKPTQTTGTLYKNTTQNKGEFAPKEKVINVDEIQPIEEKKPEAAQSVSLPTKSGKAPSESGSVPSKHGNTGSETSKQGPILLQPANLDTVSSRAETATPTASTSVPDPDVIPSTSSARSVGGSTVAAESDVIPLARESTNRPRRSIPSATEVILLNRDMFMSETNTETSDPTSSGFIGQLDDGFSSNIEYVNPRQIEPLENYTDETSTDTVEIVSHDETNDTTPTPVYDPYFNPNPTHLQDMRSSLKKDTTVYTDSDLPSELPSTTEPSERAPSSYVSDNTSIESMPDESSRTANYLPISVGNVTSVDVTLEPLPRGYVEDDIVTRRPNDVSHLYGDRPRFGFNPEPIIDEDDNVVSVRF